MAEPETPPTAPARLVDPRYFAIVLVPVLIYVVERLLGDHFMPTDLPITAEVLVQNQPWLEAAGRYRFLAATWLYGALAILAALLMARTLLQPATKQTRVAGFGTFFFVLFLAALPTLLGGDGSEGTHIYGIIGSAVFEGALAMGDLPGCASPTDRWLMGTCGDNPVLSLFNGVLDLINIFAGLAVGGMIVNMILSLDDRPCATVEEKAKLYAENLRHMRQQLYLSGTILTFGMLFVASWIYWPLPLIAEAEREAYGTLLRSSALFAGTYFSLLLLSFYLPVALILDGWVRSLAKQATGSDGGDQPPNIEAWRKSHGLTESAGDYMRAGFAATAPILAAFLGGISPLSL